MIQFVLGIILIAFGGVVVFLGQQLVTSNWGFWSEAAPAEASAKSHSAANSGQKSSDGAEPAIDDRAAQKEFPEYTYNPEADWWERPGPSEDALFRETEVQIRDKVGNVMVGASVFEVLNECAWVSGSAKKFEYRNGRACSLGRLLKDRKYQERLAVARHLVFVGMESYKAAPNKSVGDCSHAWLSECRAEEMAERTYNEVPKEWPTKTDFWIFDIGAANTRAESLEFDQRRAIIIGIRNRRSDIPIQDAITFVARRVPLHEVKLSDYSKIATAIAARIEWTTGGQLNSHE